MTYKDVQKTITAQFNEYHRTRIAAAVQQQLEKKHSATIHRDVRKKDLSLIGINEQ